MCKEDFKPVAHLLLHCRFAKAYGDLALSYLSISWVATKFVKNNLLRLKKLRRRIRPRHYLMGSTETFRERKQGVCDGVETLIGV